ncbi:MAG: ribosome-associated translation inhibitor RaiA [Armatimonadota bacterium]|nr:ribosome-associated translation inhibitor RaiA [bacterium]MCS7309571.1 ribosome-associated translation inhibitor RaiA [Armatimonadota bacterium]MDW8104786.1 ribosome-associated translation inhibitor RaiA [Armatimonadota bacterium]MDW8291201.1 ribosome-associated translation inhibitor RaiA [Armatimonadota bacterium]
MQVQFRDVEGSLPPAVREYVEKKINRLERHFKNFRNATVVHEEVRGRHTVEITLNGDGITLRAEDSNSDLRATVDRVVDKLDAQLARFKGKRFRSLAKREREDLLHAEEITLMLEAVGEEPAAEPGEETLPFRVARIKRFALKPSTLEEAAMEMEMLQHDFHVFLDAETQGVRVLYRRKDGTYGLLIGEE